MPEAGAVNKGVIKGKLIDARNEAVPYANILLRNEADSALYKGELSNDQGVFLFDLVKNGRYFIEIQSIGFEKLFRQNIEINDINQEIDLGVLILNTSSQTLNAVTITSERPFIEKKADRTVVNVENNSINAGSSVIEVMDKLPGVQVTQDGQISLKGNQNVNVFIDGKPAVLSGEELANRLKGMHSSTVQKIEIITKPSAKYEAAGSAGIINIVTKRNSREGLNGTVNAGYGQGRYEKYNAGFNLNFKHAWYNLFLNYSFAHRKDFHSGDSKRNFLNSTNPTPEIIFESYGLKMNNSHTPVVGADLQLSKKSSLSLVANGLANLADNSVKTLSTTFGTDHSQLSSFDFLNGSVNAWYNYSGSARFQHQIDTTGKEFSIDLDYSNYWNNSDQDYTDIERDSNGNFVNEAVLTADQKGTLSIYAAKADYTHPFKKNMRLETGVKSSYVSSDKDTRFFNEKSGSMVFDSSMSNHFIYSENINAAYLNGSKEYAKLTLQAGLRAEQTIVNGKQLITGQTFNRSYIQLFPSFFFDYKVNDDHGINILFGRRVDRPDYEDMNPLRYFINSTTYGEGNPYLKPQTSYNSEITYSYKNSFFATFSHNYIRDFITGVLIQEADKGVVVSTVMNFKSQSFYNLDLTYSKKLTKWWITNTTLSPYYGQVTGSTINYSLNKFGTPTFQFNTNNNFPFTEHLSADVGYNYAYRRKNSATAFQSFSSFNVGVKLSVFNNRGSITCNVSDLFWDDRVRGTTNIESMVEVWNVKRDSRVVRINFSYRFGGNEKIGRVRGNTSTDEEKRRVTTDK